MIKECVIDMLSDFFKDDLLRLVAFVISLDTSIKNRIGVVREAGEKMLTVDAIVCHS